MELLYKKSYKNYYNIIEKYYLVAGQALFLQRLYKINGVVVKSLICQVFKSPEEIQALVDSVSFHKGVLWFDDIKRPAVPGFKVIKVNENAPLISFKLDPVILSILEVIFNEYQRID